MESGGAAMAFLLWDKKIKIFYEICSLDLDKRIFLTHWFGR